MDKNNQYDQAMTKPLPYGCIKRMKTPSMLEFNLILDRLSHEDSIGHLLFVDIKFHNENSKTMLFNEIYPPIFEKNPKKIRAHERSTVQLMSVLNRNKHKDIIHSFKCNAKTHSTLDEKKLSLYAEHLHFLIKRAGWLVTSIYRHFTFEQSKLKNKIHNEPKSQAKGNISRRARLL